VAVFGSNKTIYFSAGNFHNFRHLSLLTEGHAREKFLVRYLIEKPLYCCCQVFTMVPETLESWLRYGADSVLCVLKMEVPSFFHHTTVMKCHMGDYEIESQMIFASDSDCKQMARNVTSDCAFSRISKSTTLR
jgi:hypothetical protein